MLLKTMSPALLALDEITAPEDAKAVSLCTHCGTAVIACAHAAGLDDLRQRPIYRELLALGAFHQAVIIRKTGRTAGLPHGTMGGDEMLKLIGSVMVFGSCAALGLSARQNLRRRVAAADAMLLALGLIRSEISGKTDTYAGNCRSADGKRAADYPQSLSHAAAPPAGARTACRSATCGAAPCGTARAQVGLGTQECDILCDAANYLGRYDADEQLTGLSQVERRLAASREAAQEDLANRGNLYRTCGIALGLLVILVLILSGGKRWMLI